MRKYIEPEIMIVTTDEEILQGLHQSVGSGTQLGNEGLFDDMDDELDNSFNQSDLWEEEENEAR